MKRFEGISVGLMVALYVGAWVLSIGFWLGMIWVAVKIVKTVWTHA